MASTNISYSRRSRGFIRVENERDGACDYPLFELPSVSSAIDIALEGPVIENAKYTLYALIPADISVSDLSLSVNGSDRVSAQMNRFSTETIAGKEFNVYSFPTESSEERPFLLTYGYARIGLSLLLSDSNDGEVVLTTKDIPCASPNDYQASIIAQMLSELLDIEEDEVAEWMFSGKSDSGPEFSIIDAAFRKDSPKSLSSIIQLLESSIIEYKTNYNYFRSHGFSKITQTNVKLPPRRIRRFGSHELLWVSKNPQTLHQTPYETSINYLGRCYLPREIETTVREKTYDSYENRFVIGFLDELLTNAKKIHSSLKDDVASISSIEERLDPYKRSGYSLPALTLLRQCADRESNFIAKLQEIITDLQKLEREYKTALHGVKAQFTRTPRRTKVFQEIKPYSGIYELAQRWLGFGDFALANEKLALHSLRLDKLYEYFVLFRLLCWLHKAGFREDASEDSPIEQAFYSLKSNYYFNEKRVATLYKLKYENTHIRLFYQPVIYGDEREENGITLHRLSRRRPNYDSYWTPDFMLMVCRGQGDAEWHVFDAKYSKASNLWKGYPKYGVLTEAVSKYKTDVSGTNISDKVSSVWLFSGREKGRNIQFAERSSWAAKNFAEYNSGIGALTASYSCLDEILSKILGLKKENLGNDTESNPPFKIDTPPQVKSIQSKSEQNEVISPTNTTKGEISNRCLPLIIELCNIVDNEQLLYKSHWSETNLGIAHPLLRKTAPKGRESRYYTKAQVNGESCYAYSYWLPNYENKLRVYIERRKSL